MPAIDRAVIGWIRSNADNPCVVESLGEHRAADVESLERDKPLIDRGQVRDYADLARLGCLSRERIRQIMILVWLAPDIPQAVLRLPPSECALFSEAALRGIAKMPLREDQRRTSRELFGEPEALE